MKLVYSSEPIQFQQMIIKDLLCARVHGEEKAVCSPVWLLGETDTHLRNPALKRASIRGPRRQVCPSLWGCRMLMQTGRLWLIASWRKRVTSEERRKFPHSGSAEWGLLQTEW